MKYKKIMNLNLVTLFVLFFFQTKIYFCSSNDQFNEEEEEEETKTSLELVQIVNYNFLYILLLYKNLNSSIRYLDMAIELQLDHIHLIYTMKQTGKNTVVTVN